MGDGKPYAYTAGPRRQSRALGAGSPGIATLVARYAGAIVVMGTAAGLVGSYALSRVLESRLFGVEPLDPSSYSLAAAILIGSAAAACWVPARRAMGVDPVAALKAD